MTFFEKEKYEEFIRQKLYIWNDQNDIKKYVRSLKMDQIASTATQKGPGFMENTFKTHDF